MMQTNNQASEKHPSGDQTAPGGIRLQSTPGVGDSSGSEGKGRGIRRQSEATSPASSRESTPERQTRVRNNAAAQLSDAAIADPLTNKRTKWTDEMNRYVVHAYYLVTELEKNKSGFRKKLHNKFKDKYPEHIFTEQKVAGQLRSVMKNKYISEEIIEDIKKAVEKELYNNITSEIQHPQCTIQEDDETEEKQTDPIEEELTTNNALEPNEDHDLEIKRTYNKEDTQKLQEEMERAILEYIDTDPTLRPILPKHHSSKKLTNTTKIMNEVILPQYLRNDIKLEEVHAIIYCGALTITRAIGGKIIIQSESAMKIKNNKPGWMMRLEKRIENLRADLNRIIGYKEGKRSRRLNNSVKRILEKYKIHAKHDKNNENIDEANNTIKQKLAALNKRLRRYRDTTLRKTQNKQFTNNEKQFYNNLNKTNSKGNGAPTKDDIEKYWTKLWSEKVNHNKETQWIEREEEANQSITRMEYKQITIDEIGETVKKTHNWKATGIDNIHNYYYKYFTCTHNHLARNFNKILDDPKTMPEFMSTGVTYLKSKDEDTRNATKYRPITCLPTIYKIFTSIIANRLYDHCSQNRILAMEQKGCIKQSKGCKEQLIIDMIVTEQIRKQKRNLHSSYIDFKKAYDSVPHSWLQKVLDIYKVHPIITECLKTVMNKWKTKIILNTEIGKIETKYIQINRGIFQGDSLSPLWFCLALNPLSNILKREDTGVQIKQNKEVIYTLSHLLYMDDIKIYAATEMQLKHLVKMTYNFSNDIKMEFGLDKCRTQTIKKGKQVVERVQGNNMPKIEPMYEDEMYKYLGMHQKQCTEHKYIKETIKEKYFKRINMILKSKLNAKNQIKAINTYAIPLLTYTFGIVKWTQTEMKDIQTKTNVAMTKHRCHHPKAAVERTTLKRKDGGRGLIDLSNLHNNSIINLRKYFYSKQAESQYYRAIVKADKHTPLILSDEEKTWSIVEDADKLTRWKEKALHGRFPHDVDQDTVDKQASYNWLKRGELQPETEGFFIAIQDQVIKTNNYRRYILKDGIESDLCRRCKKASETIHHVIGGCQTIAQSDYKFRHDQVGKIIHQELALKYKLIEHKVNYYQYEPATILENNEYEMYWDRTIITDKRLEHNRPDIVVKKKKENEVLLIDFAVTNNNNLTQTYREKITKYIDLCFEIKDMWKYDRVRVIPLVLSNMGVIPKTLIESLKAIDLEPYQYQLMQKSVILNTCHTARRFLYM